MDNLTTKLPKKAKIMVKFRVKEKLNGFNTHSQCDKRVFSTCHGFQCGNQITPLITNLEGQTTLAASKYSAGQLFGELFGEYKVMVETNKIKPYRTLLTRNPEKRIVCFITGLNILFLTAPLSTESDTTVKAMEQV